MEKWLKPMEQLTAIRFSNQADEVICAAAKLQGVSRSEFIRRSATERARRILQRTKRTEQQQISQ